MAMCGFMACFAFWRGFWQQCHPVRAPQESLSPGNPTQSHGRGRGGRQAVRPEKQMSHGSCQRVGGYRTPQCPMGAAGGSTGPSWCSHEPGRSIARQDAEMRLRRCQPPESWNLWLVGARQGNGTLLVPNFCGSMASSNFYCRPCTLDRILNILRVPKSTRGL